MCVLVERKNGGHVSRNEEMKEEWRGHFEYSINETAGKETVSGKGYGSR